MFRQRLTRKMYIYVETNILEMFGYQADGTHSEPYKITAGRPIHFELGDEAEAEH
jgi:hypothetical protein